MSRDEFFNRLRNMVKDSDIDWEENFVGDEKEGELYIKFTNITHETMSATVMKYRETELIKAVDVYSDSLDEKTLRLYVYNDLLEKYNNVDYETIDAFIAMTKEMVSLKDILDEELNK